MPTCFHKFERGLAAALTLGLVVWCASSNGQDLGRSDSKIALVIGNAAYRSGPLHNPTNDAEAVAAGLQLLGFQVVLIENTSRKELLAAMRQFSVSAAHSDVRLFYYAGHGAQSKGHNYLLPVDAELQSEEALPQQGADVTEFLDRLGTIKSGVNLVILDACRNNPFGSITTQLADSRHARTRGLPVPPQAGLAPVIAPSGTLIAFSTAPGSVALDSANQRHSVYTKHLLQWLSTPGLPVERLFKLVRIDVVQETQQQQVPWESSSLMGDFCFQPGARGACGNM